MTDPPPGYLGADARVRRGPAPELVAAGYELELADSALLERGLTLADVAHVLAHPAIPETHRRELLDGLLDLRVDEPDSRYGDLVNVRERVLEQRVGQAAGWLNAGRPRREAGRIAFRIALRERLLDLHGAIARFAAALTAQAATHRDTLMPDYTYLQIAQPTTAGHWLLSFAHPALRDGERISRDFDATNRSPAGAGGVNGSRYAIDRDRLATLLGFSRPIEHTRDAMWQTDGFAEATWHAALAATNAGRFADDLEIYGSDEFGLLRIGDELCRASALMPQKRNPYALVVLRGGARTLLGRATGVLASQQTPSGRTDNLLYAYGEIAGAVELATRLLNLAAATAESLEIDPERGEQALMHSDAMATDVAEQRTLDTGEDYRSAYRRIGRAVAAGERQSLDPRDAIATRTVTGGAAPAPMDAMLAHAREQIEATRRRAATARQALATAERDLLARARGQHVG
ncbi:MAG TPA: lyase family protein [Solirubrobacter sp.]|nr:lyase family protein [Solirubrobacter sp.]